MIPTVFGRTRSETIDGILLQELAQTENMAIS